MPYRKYKSIMIVEDDVSIRETLKDVIEQTGFVVFMASDGEEALKKLEILEESALPCLVLTDLMMPKMDGWELIQKLQKHHSFSSLPIVVMSAQGTSMPGHVFLKKPFQLDDMLQWIEKLASSNPDCFGRVKFDRAA